MHLCVSERPLSCEVRGQGQLTHGIYPPGWEPSPQEGGLLHHWSQWGGVEGCWVCLLEMERGKNGLSKIGKLVKTNQLIITLIILLKPQLSFYWSTSFGLHY